MVRSVQSFDRATRPVEGEGDGNDIASSAEETPDGHARVGAGGSLGGTSAIARANVTSRL